MPRNGSGVYSKPAGTTAVADTLIESAKYNQTIDDLVADANEARPITAGGTGATSKSGATTALEAVSYGASQTLTAAQQAQARSNVSAPLKGHIYGLTLSNNVTDPTNDIDIAAGEAASTEANPVLMVLSSAITKRLDAAWAVGSGNGGLDTGSIANGTYFVWLIQRSDTGVVDALYSTSATSPTMPSGYDRKRRIGAILREGGTIISFIQTSPTRYERTAGIFDRNSTAALASSLITLSVPIGVPIRPILLSDMQANPGAAHSLANVIGSARSGSANLSFQQVIGVSGTQTASRVILDGTVLTNTSGQVYYSAAFASGTPLINTLVNRGWYDDTVLWPA